MQAVGAAVQFVAQRNVCQDIQPAGGVRDKPLGRARAPPIDAATRTRFAIDPTMWVNWHRYQDPGQENRTAVYSGVTGSTGTAS